MGYLGATLTQVFTQCARSERVNQRCHNSPDGKRGYRVRVMSRTKSARRIWGVLKNSVGWVPGTEEDGWLLGLAEARRICALRAPHEVGGRWKIQNRKNVYLSPYVEEPLNSKVIKSFVPELRSRKCFSCFEIPMYYVYMWRTFYVRFTPICIWLWYVCNGYSILKNRIWFLE